MRIFDNTYVFWNILCSNWKMDNSFLVHVLHATKIVWKDKTGHRKRNGVSKLVKEENAVPYIVTEEKGGLRYVFSNSFDHIWKPCPPLTIFEISFFLLRPHLEPIFKFQRNFYNHWWLCVCLSVRKQHVREFLKSFFQFESPIFSSLETGSLWGFSLNIEGLVCNFWAQQSQMKLKNNSSYFYVYVSYFWCTSFYCISHSSKNVTIYHFTCLFPYELLPLQQIIPSWFIILLLIHWKHNIGLCCHKKSETLAGILLVDVDKIQY